MPGHPLKGHLEALIAITYIFQDIKLSPDLLDLQLQGSKCSPGVLVAFLRGGGLLGSLNQDGLLIVILIWSWGCGLVHLLIPLRGIESADAVFSVGSGHGSAFAVLIQQ